MDIPALVSRQREYFLGGATLEPSERKESLLRLQKAILAREKEIAEALHADLRKSPFESYMSETGMVLDELRYIAKHLEKWAKPKRVPTPLSQFPSRSFICKEPYGVTLVMSPWNYPFLLSLDPLIGSIAAGNCVILKPSAYAPHTSHLLADLISSVFSPAHVAVVEGGREENSSLLEQRFDFIFFTGSVSVGKLVMEKAAQNLTPVVLELGGKSPCIIDETANLPMAARRLVFGKLLNAGQTCVAPDYVLVKRERKEDLISLLKSNIQDALGQNPGKNPEFPKIINQKHFQRLCAILEGETILLGGETDEAALTIAPTVTEASAENPSMQEEIFGPILPILTYDKPDDAIRFIREREKPLALYLFTESKAFEKRILQEVSFGGGCINDTIIHLATHHMPFGGVGHSGMGSYHGKKSFDAFTHEKSIVKKSSSVDLPVRYHPYTEKKLKMLKKFLK
jgi:aldehyde dehydrogenase (NAD+)